MSRLNEAIKLSTVICISVLLSLWLYPVLVEPQEGPPGSSGIMGIQGEQGESIVGPQGIRGVQGAQGDPAFSWMALDSIDVVWELGLWEPEGYQIGSVTFDINGSIWWIDITVSQQTVVPTKVTVYNTNREEGVIEWTTEEDFAQYRMLMTGAGEYGMFVYGSDIQRIDVVVKQVID